MKNLSVIIMKMVRLSKHLFSESFLKGLELTSLQRAFCVVESFFYIRLVPIASMVAKPYLNILGVEL
jgi:hypothetical protein